MSTNAQMFPGVYFDVVQPVVEDSLPRMDIAAFVGYASAGPIDTPVAVNDLRRFREIFGLDVDLAWDAETNQMITSVLGRSVDAFFRNGGRRCWVVRVADETLAQTARFVLPGMIRADGENIEAAVASARSPGSWAEKIKIQTVLQTTQLAFAKSTSLDQPYLQLGPAGWSLNVIASRAQLHPGDLVRVQPYPNTSLYFIVDAITSTAFGVHLSGAQAYLLDENSPASPAMFDPDLALTLVETEGITQGTAAALETELSGKAIFSIASFDALGISQSLYALPTSNASPPSDDSPTWPMAELYAAQLLRFEFLASDDNKQQWRLSALGFSKNQARFWGSLPSDQNLFARTEGRNQKNRRPSTQTLLDEINTPRFPLASSFAEQVEDHPWIYLPVGMPSYADAARARRGEYLQNANALLLNGIANAGSTIFVDERLAGVGSDLLRREGHALAFLREQSPALKGIHSLLTIDEATLVAIPDAAHRRWDTIAPPAVLPLPAPEWIYFQPTELANEYLIQWTKINSVVGYRIEWSQSPDFTASSSQYIARAHVAQLGEPIDLIPEPATEYYLKLTNTCPLTWYFRVRAEGYDQVSVWSKNIARRLPDADFIDCEFDEAEFLALTLGISAAPLMSPAVSDDDKGYWLNLDFDYSMVNESSVDRVDIQKSSEFIFLNPETLFSASPLLLDSGGSTQDGVLHWLVESPLDSTVFYRARLIRLGVSGVITYGPWSNTASAWPTRLSQATLQAKADFSDGDILSLHRALLRLCYARGDLFGVLSLPKHYTVQDALDHYAKLSPLAAFNGSDATPVDLLTARVNPLSIAENNVCSHGALYYPWLTSQNESLDQGSIRFQSLPPDGAVVGKIANRSIVQGPWVAPANSPLIDVFALETSISPAQWAQLMNAHINVIRADARDFLLLSADTLSDSSELREINVRRLMSMLMRLAHREGNRYLFEPNSAIFQERVQQHFERLFDGLFARGAFSGRKASEAYRVVTDASVNSRQSMEAGRFIVELQVAPSYALKFIRVRLIQSGPAQLQVQEVAV